MSRNSIQGSKLMEINVFSRGGLGSARQFEGVNFAHAVVEAWNAESIHGLLQEQLQQHGHGDAVNSQTPCRCNYLETS